MKPAPAPAPIRDLPHDSLGVLVSLVRAEMIRTLEGEMVAAGLELRFIQYLILRRLHALGPMSAGELARSVELDGGAMTRQLDQLADKGYLRRVPHQHDRRALRIELTEAGNVLCGGLLADCHNRALEAAQRALSAVEREQLMDYLERVLRTLRHKD